jgi:putative peptidoglycan lipid II flippase
MYLPIGLFGVSIATAALPDLARHAGDGDHAAIRRGVSSALRLMLMLNIPAMVGLIVLAEPIVALLYQRGQFTDADTQATAAALRFYAPGLIGYSIVRIASPTFYSLGNSRTPVIVSVMSVTVNLVLNILLFRIMGFRGLALGTALAALFNAGTLLWLLRGRLGGIEGRQVAIAFLKIAGAAVLMGIVAAFTAARLETMMPGSSELVRVLRVSTAISVALVALVVSARLLRIEEFTDATERVLRRVLPARR